MLDPPIRSSLNGPRKPLVLSKSMGPVNRTSEHLRDLVIELDDKLAVTRGTVDREPTVIDGGRTSRTVPAWLGFLAVTLLGIGIGVMAVQPWQERCSYTREVCAIAQLDIDALRITIPNSELIAALPNIDTLDPNDELTAGDIFAMERFAHLNFEELLSDEEIEQVLATSG
jgi:hypothetical protein